MVLSWGLPRLVIKSHPEKKVHVALGHRSSPKVGGSPIIFLQRLKLVTSKLSRGFAKADHKIPPTPKKCDTWPWAKKAPSQEKSVPFTCWMYSFLLPNSTSYMHLIKKSYFSYVHTETIEQTNSFLNPSLCMSVIIVDHQSL